MKRKIKVLCYILLCVVSVIMGALLDKLYDAMAEQSKWSIEEMRTSTTKIESENCIICQQISLYGNEDNLGIIYLNENETYHVGINRYDDYGKLLKKTDPSMHTLFVPAKDSGKGVSITTDTNRGYADVDISLGENKKIDMEKVTNNCCSDCLNKLQEEYYSTEPYDIVVLNYKTKELQLLSADLRSFLIGDFYVTCEQRYLSEESEITEVDLLIFYCPERYQ